MSKNLKSSLKENLWGAEDLDSFFKFVSLKLDIYLNLYLLLSSRSFANWINLFDMEPQKKEKVLSSKEEQEIMSDISKATSGLGIIAWKIVISVEDRSKKKGFLASVVRNAIEAFDNDKKYSWMIPFYQVTNRRNLLRS
jgi:hypothetical protein